MLTDGRTEERTETCMPKSPMLKQVRQKVLCLKKISIKLYEEICLKVNHRLYTFIQCETEE